VGGKSARRSRTRRAEAAGLQKPPFFLARGDERVETDGSPAIGATVAREMNELILSFNAAGVRYLLISGQAMRLSGMPRFSMDWDFFIPSRDEINFSKLNEILKEELDVPVVPLGSRGENFIQTYHTKSL
jgi:hypothetical protein